MPGGRRPAAATRHRLPAFSVARIHSCCDRTRRSEHYRTRSVGPGMVEALHPRGAGAAPAGRPNRRLRGGRQRNWSHRVYAKPLGAQRRRPRVPVAKAPHSTVRAAHRILVHALLISRFLSIIDSLENTTAVTPERVYTSLASPDCIRFSDRRVPFPNLQVTIATISCWRSPAFSHHGRRWPPAPASPLQAPWEVGFVASLVMCFAPLAHCNQPQLRELPGNARPRSGDRRLGRSGLPASAERPAENHDSRVPLRSLE